MKIITREVTNCGTYAGYLTHARIDEAPCSPCREARNAYMREYRRRKGHTKSALVPVGTDCPNCGHHLTL